MVVALLDARQVELIEGEVAREGLLAQAVGKRYRAVQDEGAALPGFCDEDVQRGAVQREGDFRLPLSPEEARAVAADGGEVEVGFMHVLDVRGKRAVDARVESRAEEDAGEDALGGLDAAAVRLAHAHLEVVAERALKVHDARVVGRLKRESSHGA